jgi:phage shock protein PspC (stress-responsive transcriptional regulator)
MFRPIHVAIILLLWRGLPFTKQLLSYFIIIIIIPEQWNNKS